MPEAAIEAATRSDFKYDDFAPRSIERVRNPIFARALSPEPFEWAVERFSSLWVDGDQRQDVGENKIARLV